VTAVSSMTCGVAAAAAQGRHGRSGVGSMRLWPSADECRAATPPPASSTCTRPTCAATPARARAPAGPRP
jgi:hypothetical protein